MMRNNDFVAFILTHGRADNVITYKTLKNRGYTGRIVLVIDNEDDQAERYYEIYGKDDVYMFDKPKAAQEMDEGCNFQNRGAILYARNKCFDIAEELGYRYFIELDDDYNNFSFSYASVDGTPREKSTKRLDEVFDILLDFYKSIPAATIAMAQRGDFIAGKYNYILKNEQLKRKAMNSFICDTQRRFDFRGRINEDVNTYVTLGRRGELFFQVPQVALHQEQTQQNTGGMTGIYGNFGTYVKSFFSVMYAPSCVNVAMMGEKYQRLHHHVNWDCAIPKILDQRFKKA